MALKFKLDSLEGLDEATQKLYVKSGDKYVLAVEGVQEGDVAGLKSQVEKLLGEKKDIEKKLADIEKAQKEADEAKRAAEEEAAKKAGDIAALEKSWQGKLEAKEKELKDQYEGKIKKMESALSRLLRTNVANEIAMKIGLDGSESVLSKLLLDRIGYEEEGGDYKTVVLDKEGKRSALSIEELMKEVQADKAFAPLLKGSNASGGGAGGGSNKSGGAAKKFSEMSEKERLELYRSNPAEYRKLKEADKQSA
jgi:hypothetical protein